MKTPKPVRLTARKSRAKRTSLRDVVQAAMDNGMKVKVGIEPLGTPRETIQAGIDAHKAAENRLAEHMRVKHFHMSEFKLSDGEPAQVYVQELTGTLASDDELDEELACEFAQGQIFRSVYRVAGYGSLEEVLFRAYQQASHGKGFERHGRGLTFDAQPTQVISDLLDSDAGLAFQAVKKVNEGMRLEHDAKIKEMLGAINYIASIVIRMERNKQ